MTPIATIEVSLPPKPLSPNARPHWATKHKATRNYKATVAGVVRVLHPELVDRRWKHATVRYRFFFPLGRKRDDDNYIAMMKPARDALEQVGVVENDAGITLLPVEMGSDKKNPRVEIVIEEAS